MIPPTRVGRPVGRLSADTLPTPTISSFFTVIYTALKSPIHSFEFPYDIHNRAESIQLHKRVRGPVDKNVGRRVQFTRVQPFLPFSPLFIRQIY